MKRYQTHEAAEKLEHARFKASIQASNEEMNRKTAKLLQHMEYWRERDEEEPSTLAQYGNQISPPPPSYATATNPTRVNPVPIAPANANAELNINHHYSDTCHCDQSR